MKKIKRLKIWNGRGHGKYDREYTIYVAAYSQAEAARLVAAACEALVTVSEIRKYYHPNAWGKRMQGIVPTEPCVYVTKGYNGAPQKII